MNVMISAMTLGVFLGNIFVKKYLGCEWNEAIITAAIAAIIFIFLIYSSRIIGNANKIF